MYYDRPPRRSLFSYFIVAIIGALIGGLVSPYIGNEFIYGKILPDPNPQIVGEKNPSSIEINTNDDINTVAAVAKKSMGSVVGITTVQIQRDIFWDREVEGVGSGFVVDSNGYIMTNSHVVGDGKAKRINVLLENGETYEAELLWNDRVLDLAMIKIDAKGLEVSDLGNSDELQVGEIAVAIGNPLGLEFERTLTSGFISGLNRSIRVDQHNSIDNLIQTDASINPGNSGGPLLNSKGQVIGINTVKIKSQVAEGLGFAIPINIAKPIIDSIVKTGDFRTVSLGIKPTELEVAERVLGTELGADYGVVVVETIEGTPAHKAGLEQLDIITGLDGKKVESVGELNKLLYNYKDGDKAKLSLVRNGQEMEVEIILKVLK